MQDKKETGMPQRPYEPEQSTLFIFTPGWALPENHLCCMLDGGNKSAGSIHCAAKVSIGTV